MSAHPTRAPWEATPVGADADAALQEGNRVLDSISRQEALGSLLAFSELHAIIRRHSFNGRPPLPDDMFQSERFVLDEVLQLICDRALAITAADGVLIALADGSGLACRASSGSFLVERGTHLTPASGFLAECLESGAIVRCDDGETDARVEFDLTKILGASASVLIPLRGRYARLGVMQAFSSTPFGLCDSDIRSL